MVFVLLNLLIQFLIINPIQTLSVQGSLKTTNVNSDQMIKKIIYCLNLSGLAIYSEILL
jgi:biopolymer transport protein ExbD